jgi:hypothetical protein
VRQCLLAPITYLPNLRLKQRQPELGDGGVQLARL